MSRPLSVSGPIRAPGDGSRPLLSSDCCHTTALVAIWHHDSRRHQKQEHHSHSPSLVRSGWQGFGGTPASLPCPSCTTPGRRVAPWRQVASDWLQAMLFFWISNVYHLSLFRLSSTLHPFSDCAATFFLLYVHLLSLSPFFIKMRHPHLFLTLIGSFSILSACAHSLSLSLLLNVFFRNLLISTSRVPAWLSSAALHLPPRLVSLFVSQIYQ